MGNSVKIRCFPIFHFFASPYFRNGGLLINSSSWGRTLIVSLPLQDSPTKKLSLPDHVVMTKSVGSAPNSPVTAKRHSSWTTTDGGGNAQTVDRWDTGWGGHLFRRFRNMFSKSSSCLHGSCSTAQQPWGFPAHNTWLYSASLLQGLQLKLKNNHTSGGTLNPRIITLHGLSWDRHISVTKAGWPYIRGPYKRESLYCRTDHETNPCSYPSSCGISSVSAAVPMASMPPPSAAGPISLPPQAMALSAINKYATMPKKWVVALVWSIDRHCKFLCKRLRESRLLAPSGRKW